MTLALFLLRTVQLGLSISELDGLEYGTVVDMMIEAGNDGYDYKAVASQADMDKF